MKEYIERQKLIDALPDVKEDKQISLYGAVADVMVIASSIPSADVVEVVRCKDCKYWAEEKDFGMFCSHWGSTLAESQADDFCSYGERKERE